MRMVLKATLDTEKSGRVLQEGRMQEVLGSVLGRLQPEAAYFYGEQGGETCSSSSTCRTPRSSLPSPSRCSTRQGPMSTSHPS
jgi:hypothetical protein